MNPLHQVISEAGLNAVSSRYVGPLLGNGELCLFLDENGVMHDYAALPARPSPRIYWAGRRQGTDRRPMVPFGYFTAQPSWEWMESTQWSQSLEPRTGIVRTVHERVLGGREETETVLLLDRNLIAVHKKIEKLRGATALDFRYRFCPAGKVGLPAGVTLTGSGKDAVGAWLDFQLAGVVSHLGRIRMWADKPCEVEINDNELRLVIPLNAAADEVTVYLALADDLGDEMFYHHTGVAGHYAHHPMMQAVTKALHAKPVTRCDPFQTIQELGDWTRKDGWAAVRQHQVKCWEEFFKPGWLKLPAAPTVQAIWETGMYATRTQLTKWSIPVAIHADIFNGMSFWDSICGGRVLLQAGHWPLVERMAEHSQSVVPVGIQMTGGIGARQEQASYEGGAILMQPSVVQIYEVHACATPARLIWAWAQYAGAGKEVLERYYPVFWGAAEFFRRWMVYKGPDGKYFTGACVDVDESDIAVCNGADTIAGARGSMDLAARVAERLGRDANLVAKWREVAGGLARDRRVNSRGVLALNDSDEGVSAIPLGWAAGLFSNGWIRHDDPALRRTLEIWVKECKARENWTYHKSNDPERAKVSWDINNPDPIAWTGWPVYFAFDAAALIGDGEIAFQIVQELTRCAGNFGSLYEAKMMTDGFTSVPWFVTSSAQLSASIMMMLVQDDGEQIQLLPAVPGAWKDLSYQLAVTNRTTVRVEVKDGVLKSLELTGPTTPRRVQIPARFNPAALLGQAVAEDPRGQTFIIQPKEIHTRPTVER